MEVGHEMAKALAPRQGFLAELRFEVPTESGGRLRMGHARVGCGVGG